VLNANGHGHIFSQEIRVHEYVCVCVCDCQGVKIVTLSSCPWGTATEPHPTAQDIEAIKYLK